MIANVTDIDDKILIKSAEAGVPWFAHAYRFERELHDAYAALGCLPPTYEPRATGHVPEMLELIEVLIERGHAYAGRGRLRRRLLRRAVLAGVRILSRQRIDDMEPAERRRSARQARSARLRAVEGPQAVRADHAPLADALGSRPTGLAPGVLGHGRQVPGRRVRHPRRRS